MAKKTTYTKLTNNKLKIGRILIISIFALIVSKLPAQEMLGIVNSNYSGITGALINPSSIVNSKLFIDVNILGADLFIENNFLYIHRNDFHVLNYLKRNPEFPSYKTDDRGFDYYADVGKISSFESTRISGLSGAIIFGRHAFGLTTSFRTASSLKNVPTDIGILAYEGLEYEPLHGVEQHHGKFDVAAVVWGETGLNYALILSKSIRNQWSAGICLKLLFAHSGAYIYNRKLDYTLINDTVIDIENIDADVGFALPVDYDNNEYPDDGSFIKGNGLGLDLGVNYQRLREDNGNRMPKRYCACEYEDYIYRIGFSILDLGKINFKENAQVHSFSAESVFWDNIDTLEYRNINSFMQDLSAVFYGNPDASNSGNSFGVNLPTAISLQADFQYYPQWYINSTIILPIKTGNARIDRPSQLALSLRYESRLFEVAVPLSLYGFKKPRIGLAIRFYYFTLGTDKLGGLFGFNDFTGLDLYFAVKFNIQKGWCARYRPSKDCSHLDF